MAVRRSIRRVRPAAVVVAAWLGAGALFAGSPFGTTAARAADGPPAAGVAPATPDVQPFAGVVNLDRALVYSGPDERFYATARLDKGAKVRVLGATKDFYKVAPPEGSFSFASKVYVEKSADGATGKVVAPDMNVRAGSVLNTYKTTVQTVLDKGETVTILGEQDGYYKIVPPAGVTLYVKRSAIDADPTGAVVQTPPAPVVPAVQPQPQPQPPPVAAANPPVPPMTPANPPANPGTLVTGTLVPATPPDPVQPPAPAAGTGPAVPPPAPDRPIERPPERPVARPYPAAGGPTTVPSVAIAPPRPTTEPAKPLAERFDIAEAAFATASRQPLEKQPLDGLRWRYRSMLNDPALTTGMKQVVDSRLATIDFRIAAKNEVAAVRTEQEQNRAKRQALQAEQQELAQRAADQQVTTYTAVGTLRVSSLQQAGGGTLYRLTDPGTGRTVLYLRTADPKYADLLNQFVGVKGDLSEDPALGLKYIAPTAAEVVDPAKVNASVSATIVPPSMVAKTPAAAN